jgi:hypothetical protein
VFFLPYLMLVILTTEKRIDLGWWPIYFLFLKLFGSGMALSPEYGSYKGHLSGSSKHEAVHWPVFKSGDGDGSALCDTGNTRKSSEWLGSEGLAVAANGASGGKVHVDQ